jgi:hypothetical protein
VIEPKEMSDPAAAAASVRARLGFSKDPARRGPVPLARFLDEFNLLHVTLPQLTRAGIANYLLGEGILAAGLVDGGDPDEVLSGFIFTTGTDGLVFVGEREPVASAKSDKPELKLTPLGRWRFTAAHELGHFLLHQDRMIAGRWLGDTKETIREVGGPGTATMEGEAIRFAAELLMPADVCRARAEAFRASYRVCPRATFAYHLSSELLVSPEALRHRLEELGLGDE